MSRIPSLIDVHVTEDLMSNGAKVIDVRTPTEYESAHISGSYNVPLDQLSEQAAELRRVTSDPIILVCRSGARAQQAEDELRNVGLQHVAVMDGGMEAWERCGKRVRHNHQQKWGMERQVRGVAGTLAFAGALGGLLLWRPLSLIALFVGSGLIFSAVTNTCGMAKILARLPYNRGAQCDIREVVRQLATDGARS